LLKNSDYYIDLQIGKTPITPTPTINNTTKPVEDTIISPTPTNVLITKKEINETMLIPIKDSEDNTITEIDYKLVSYEFRNEIVAGGKLANSIDGREFLIITLEIKNNSENTIDINSRDYLRLSVNNDSWLSPEVHNDPVVIQPLSTKITRVGFIVNTTDDNFSLKLSEIGEEGKTINLQK
jgi:hypothetical protein